MLESVIITFPLFAHELDCLTFTPLTRTETATQTGQMAVERDPQTLATGAPAPVETSTDVQQGVGPSVYLTAVQPTTARAPGRPRSEVGLA